MIRAVIGKEVVLRSFYGESGVEKTPMEFGVGRKGEDLICILVGKGRMKATEW